jgi:Na+/melibiose symporter-like transporter
MLAAKTALYAAMLAAAGLPLYIHLPQFATAELGLSLTAVGTILIGVRILDFLQDPLLGWLVDRHPSRRAGVAAFAALGLGAGFAMLFGVGPPVQAELWLVLSLVLLFTCYSLATILIYGQSVAFGELAGAGGQYRIAGYREAGLVGGVVVAALAPTLFGAMGFDSYRSFGWFIAATAFLVWLVTRDLWSVTRPAPPQLSLRALHAAGGGFLLLLALANALPVALTSTLFLFFVDDRLQMPNLAGLFLVLFFAAAGLTAPLWSSLAARNGARRVLLPAMSLSVAAFLGAATLTEGSVVTFAVICLASGAALGADMVILPALFSGRLSAAGLPTGQAFGIWAFVSKSALALAAMAVLPYLEVAGYRPGGMNSPEALAALTFAYAILPCLLKLVVIAMVFRLPEEAHST